jgi:hypothetical protein
MSYITCTLGIFTCHSRSKAPEGIAAHSVQLNVPELLHSTPLSSLLLCLSQVLTESRSPNMLMHVAQYYSQTCMPCMMQHILTALAPPSPSSCMQTSPLTIVLVKNRWCTTGRPVRAARQRHSSAIVGHASPSKQG